MWCQTNYMDLTNKGIERQTQLVQNLIMNGVIKGGTNNILKQKSSNLYLATQYSPVARFLATNKTILMHKQHALQLFNFFFLQLEESYISEQRIKTQQKYSKYVCKTWDSHRKILSFSFQVDFLHISVLNETLQSQVLNLI